MASPESEPGKIQRLIASFRKRQSQPDLDDISLTTFEDVKVAIESIQKEQASKKGLRNLQRIRPFLKALEQYAGIMEVFIQVKPDALALIWVRQNHILINLVLNSNIANVEASGPD
jgi:hypothetical protein